MIHIPLPLHYHGGAACNSCHGHRCSGCNVEWFCEEEGDHGSALPAYIAVMRELIVPGHHSGTIPPAGTFSMVLCQFCAGLDGQTPYIDALKCMECGHWTRVPSRAGLRQLCDRCRRVYGRQSIAVALQTVTTRATQGCRCNRCRYGDTSLEEVDPIDEPEEPEPPEPDEEIEDDPPEEDDDEPEDEGTWCDSCQMRHF